MAYYATQRNWQIEPGLGHLQPDGLGQACPPGSIASGSQCVPCPPDSDLPECAPGPEPSFFERSAFWAPVLTGVAITIGTAIAAPYIARRLGIDV